MKTCHMTTLQILFGKYVMEILFKAFLNERQMSEVMDFVSFLARNGIPNWDIGAYEDLEKDIEWLFSENDEEDIEEAGWWWFSDFDGKSGSIIPAIYSPSYKNPEVILCKGWLSKKWAKTKKFVKKHKKTIIVAAVVVVVATVIIIATQGAGAGPAIGGGGATIGGAAAAEREENEKEHINKPGDVRFQDDYNESQKPSLEVDSFAIREGSVENSIRDPFVYPAPQDHNSSFFENRGANSEFQQTIEFISEQSDAIKGPLLEHLEADHLADSLGEEPKDSEPSPSTFMEKCSKWGHSTVELVTDFTKAIGLFGGAAGAYIDVSYQDTFQEYFVHAHEKVDSFFGTDHAYEYTQQGREEIVYLYDKFGINLASNPDAIFDIKGKLSPDGLLANAVKNLPTTTRGGPVTVAVGTAVIVGSQMKPVVPESIEKPVSVYRSFNQATGEVNYVGITNNFPRRSIEQLRQNGIQIEPINDLPPMCRSDARAVEKTLIELYKLGKDGGTLINRINSIAKANPQYADAIRRGGDILIEIGYSE